MHRTIEKVTLKRLERDSGDRRGVIAVFKLTTVPNMPYMQQEGIKFIQCLYGALGYNLYDQHRHLIGKPGEQGESFIFVGTDGTEIWVSHKYWSEEQITAFRQMVEVLAPIHRWTIVREY